MGHRRGFGTETDTLRETESIGIITKLSKTRRVESQRNLRYPVCCITEHLTTIRSFSACPFLCRNPACGPSIGQQQGIHVQFGLLGFHLSRAIHPNGIRVTSSYYSRARENRQTDTTEKVLLFFLLRRSCISHQSHQHVVCAGSTD